MKTTRKILPALAMLLVSAIMLSTASYAWFASNSKVTANDMHVKVKANTKFLEISLDKDAEQYKSGVTIGNTLGADDGFELVHAKFDSATEPDTLAWYTGSSDNREDYKGTTGGLNDAPLAFGGDLTIDRYALVNTVYVRMSPTSDTALEKLRIDTTATSVAGVDGAAITDKLIEALRILVVATPVGGGAAVGAQIYDAAGTTKGVTSYNAEAGDYLVKEVTLGTTYQVDIYIYYDGEDSSAFTNNAGSLQEVVVNVGFIAGPEEAVSP